MFFFAYLYERRDYLLSTVLYYKYQKSEGTAELSL
jgi:hypothetical protein